MPFPSFAKSGQIAANEPAGINLFDRLPAAGHRQSQARSNTPDILEIDGSAFDSRTLDGVDQAMQTHRGIEIRIDAVF